MKKAKYDDVVVGGPFGTYYTGNGVAVQVRGKSFTNLRGDGGVVNYQVTAQSRVDSAEVMYNVSHLYVKEDGVVPMSASVGSSAAKAIAAIAKSICKPYKNNSNRSKSMKLVPVAYEDVDVEAEFGRYYAANGVSVRVTSKYKPQGGSPVYTVIEGDGGCEKRAALLYTMSTLTPPAWRSPVDVSSDAEARGSDYRVAPQPPPLTAGDQSLPVWPHLMGQVLERHDGQSSLYDDMRARHKEGMRKYGVALAPGNGRDASIDLYQELLDALAYNEVLYLESDSRTDQRKLAERREILLDLAEEVLNDITDAEEADE